MMLLPRRPDCRGQSTPPGWALVLASALGLAMWAVIGAAAYGIWSLL